MKILVVFGLLSVNCLLRFLQLPISCSSVLSFLPQGCPHLLRCLNLSSFSTLLPNFQELLNEMLQPSYKIGHLIRILGYPPHGFTHIYEVLRHCGVQKSACRLKPQSEPQREMVVAGVVLHSTRVPRLLFRHFTTACRICLLNPLSI